MSETDNSDEKQIREVAQLYGFGELKLKPDSTNKKKDDHDANNSIASVDSNNDEIPLQERVDSQLYIVRETPSGQQLWKHPLSDSDAIAGHIAQNSKLMHRLPCHSFRSMLPPLISDRPPIRTPTWLTCVMRGILFAALQSYNKEDRLRFPEFVYCYFADNNDENAADEDRWAFYHGLKLSSNHNPESWIVYTLLDDMQGEDFLLFVLQALKATKNQLGKSWEYQFGEVFSSCNQATNSISELMNAMKERGYSLDGNECISSNVWISVQISIEISYQLFYNDRIKSSKFVEEISSKLAKMAMDIENSLLFGELQDDSSTTSCVDLFAFLQVVMKTYVSHKKKQLTLIRLMFETASKGVLTDFYNVQDNSSTSCYAEGLISVPQLHQILKTLWKSTTLEESVMIYREAYGILYPPSQYCKSAPDGINFQSFLIAAERYSLFSRNSSQQQNNMSLNVSLNDTHIRLTFSTIVKTGKEEGGESNTFYLHFQHWFANKANEVDFDPSSIGIICASIKRQFEYFDEITKRLATAKSEGNDVNVSLYSFELRYIISNCKESYKLSSSIRYKTEDEIKQEEDSTICWCL